MVTQEQCFPVNRLILLGLLIFFITSCGPATYEDVSTRKEYADLINHAYQSREVFACPRRYA